MYRVLDRDEIKEKAIEAIREMGPITNKQLCEITGTSATTMWRIIGEIRAIKPSLTPSKKGYFFKKSMPEKDQNHEGYKDPTAAGALKNLADQMMANGIKSEEPKKMTKTEAMHVYSAMGPEQKEAFQILAEAYADKLTQKNNNLVDICKDQKEQIEQQSERIMKLEEKNEQQAERIMKLEEQLSKWKPVSNGNDILERELLRQKAEIYEKAFYAAMGV